MSGPADRDEETGSDARRDGAPNAAGVLPFPAGGTDAAGRSRAGHRRRVAGKSSEDADPDEAAEGEPPSLAEQVQGLAAQGLSEEEIRAVLALPAQLDARAERMLADAFRTGQLLGRAQIKQAQFQAALRGRVTAQTQVLARLGEPRGEDSGESEEGDVGPGDLPPEETER